MDVKILNIEDEIKARQGFQRDTVEILAEVYFKTIQSYLDTRMNLVVITGGQNGLQLPHYHKKGFDFFVVLEGQGLLHTADLADGLICADGWQQQRLKAGDSYAVQPGQIHCLLNDGVADLTFLNISPAGHMEADYFVFEGVDHDILRES